MLEDLYRSVEQTFLQFNLRRLFFIIALLFILVTTLYIFEFFTGYCFHFQFSKTLNSLERLMDLEEKGILASKNLEPIYSDLVNTVRQHHIKVISPRIDIYPFIKFISASILPLIIIGMSIHAIIKGEPDSKNMLIGSIFTLIIFGFIGILLPTFWRTWVNPVLYLLIQLAIVLYFMKKRQRTMS